jgi:hypothetical protein
VTIYQPGVLQPIHHWMHMTGSCHATSPSGTHAYSRAASIDGIAAVQQCIHGRTHLGAAPLWLILPAGRQVEQMGLGAQWHL